YEQRQKLTLKPKMQTLQIRIVVMKPLIEEIKGFFDSCGGVEPFFLTPPGRERLLVKVFEYTETPKGGQVYELSTEFEEVMAR
ncbi:phage tail protein, partial [Neisseria sp. P0001.S005]|uniref:phage tail protein n=1 Tax=Neisseria sp. P0001.S005 TaxID=3436649 RepID=UPI003F810EAA